MQAWQVSTSLPATKQAAFLLNCLRDDAWLAAEHPTLTETGDNTMVNPEGVTVLLNALRGSFARTDETELIDIMENMLFNTWKRK